VNKLLDEVVQNLKNINQVAREAKNDDNLPTTTLAINTWETKTVPGWESVGQVSYPNHNGECRKLNYPNLDLLYQACDMAQVDCEHVYVYRDPLAVLKSTTRRSWNPSVLPAMHLYISHLNILYAQLSTHAQRTAGCWGVLEADATWTEVWTPLHKLLGWSDTEEFRQVFDELYKPPGNLTQTERQRLAPSKFDPYLQSFYRAHKDVIALCRKQVAANHMR
jgi:hypothetical protein